MTGGGLSPVHQGTILMFCLTLGLGLAAILWYVCRWYRKQKPREQKSGVRRRLKQTFSRFSQVDEELTMHSLDDFDQEMLQNYGQPQQQQVEQVVHPSPAGVNTCHASSVLVKDTVRLIEHSADSPVLTRVTMTSTPEKPYLETDM